MDREAEIGLERLKEIFESTRILKVTEARKWPSRYSYYLVVRAYEKKWDFMISGESLSDLPSMKSYQNSATRLARILERRFRNVAPNLFYCPSGRLISIEPIWPAEALPNRAASYVRLKVQDFKTGEFASCYVTVTYQQSIFDLKEDPFALHEGIVNSTRAAIDARTITFYPADAQPASLQEIRLSLASKPASAKDVIHGFLMGKVFWLGFRADNATRAVWIADPWDASYLGTTTNSLVQEAQVLAAKTVIALQPESDFAVIGHSLLTRSREFENSAPGTSTRMRTDIRWDVFISHAAEDKDALVRPLAELLERHGVRVWYDDYTLRLGDSLRRSIDEGLRMSRFGIVILSPAFFSKEWPQKELDALIAREVEGPKVLLPVWHNISASAIRQYSPLLADRFAVSSSQGISVVADRILKVVATKEGETGNESH